MKSCVPEPKTAFDITCMLHPIGNTMVHKIGA